MSGQVDTSRMSKHAAQTARTLVARWAVPADVAVRLAKGMAVTAEARVLRGRGLELSEAGMEFVARESFKIAAEDDGLSPAARGQS